MTSTVEQLKIWYASMRTMMGRLKKRAKKSGSGGDAIIDMNRTEKWVWDKFSFLIPHIETVDARNVASLAASASGTELIPSTNQKSAVASTSSRVATPTLPLASPPASQTASQTGPVGFRRGSEDRVTSGELKELLVDFMSRSTAACGSSYFGKYVEGILSKLPGQIRREAEANIMQELHRAQRAAEHGQTQPPPSQHQQAPIQLQQAVPHAPDDQPTNNKPQPGPSFVSLLGLITPDAGSFNLSSQLDTPDPLAEDDDTDL
ncbi:hypothetical protein NHX12_033134 [Muraenolepis orangiensis]|uniref:Uncharacterized protein n=1 Tax=Muraenolepis orangiensis TaxID=630683 RepID=A0A9Q0IJD4_9TELE|nr:hypothetical protein NHX12_033134 [Muraenolepis orangiensis]